MLMENIRVSGLKIANILEESDISESMEVKWLRVLFRMSVKLDHECGPMTVCPQVERMRYKSISNKNKVFTRVATTSMTSRSSFKIGYTRGIFEHNRGELLTLSLNYTQQVDLIEAFQWLAVYIGWKHDETSERTLNECQRKVQEKVRRKPHKLLRCSAKEMRPLLTCKVTSEMILGILKITQNIEYLSAERCILDIDKGMNMKHDNGLLINIEVRGKQLQPISDEFTNVPSVFLNYLLFLTSYTIMGPAR